MAKADKETVGRRIEEVYRLLLAGATRQDIRRHAAEKGWAASPRNLYRYIQAAHARLARAAEKDQVRLLNLALARREDLYARAVGMGDIRSALAIERDKAELLAMYPPKPHTYTADEVRAIVMLLTDVAGKFVNPEATNDYAEALAAALETVRAKRKSR